MIKLFIALALLVSGTAIGQIEQNVNKTTGTVSNAINDIDSIRFNAGQTEMQIILNSGTVVNHAILDVNNVTFSGQLIGVLTGLDCAGASINGSLVQGSAASGVSFVFSYTGGNGGVHNGQTVPSTGVVGLTATLAAGTFTNGSGNLSYTITGTPTTAGTASFAISIGGQSCTITLSVVLPMDAITTIDCIGATTTGSLTISITASGVSVSVPYTGGNGGTFGAQSVSSTGVTGLTADLVADTLANGNGSVTYSISGTPATSGTASFAITLGGQSCTFTINVNLPPATLTTIDCIGTTTTGSLTSGTVASGVSISVPYNGGNGGAYNAQSVSSTGVVGLIASLAAGALSNGNGSVSYTISGTPATSGTASFSITLGGQSCTFTVGVVNAPQYPIGTVNCAAGAAAIVSVTNPTTGKTWMDRNLGASQVAASSTDILAYGDLYQWGRAADGHQCRTSPTTATLSSVDQPANGNFILVNSAPFNWRSPQNVNLWQGVNGVNNPCPSGYRIPTQAELIAEYQSWSTQNSAGAFASPLKWTRAGNRDAGSGSLFGVGVSGDYWSSTVSGTFSYNLDLSTGSVFMNFDNRGNGFSVRCINDLSATINTINCIGATTTGSLTSGTTASGVSVSVPYTGGNGGAYSAQSVTSTGVVGLTAILAAGTLANGNGGVSFSISGTPTTFGTASFAITLGGQSCTFIVSVAPPLANLATINCAGATNTGTLSTGTAASGVSVSVPYTGGNAGTYSAQSVSSTGVVGLTASLAAGSLANGNGSVTYTISGTPATSGTASFAISIGGQSCTFTRSVTTPSYPIGTVHCGGVPTAIVPVTNPITGAIWMDRNLGASQVATSISDILAYGDLYQWGRRADGHQCRTSPTTAILSSVDQPPHGDFIIDPAVPGNPGNWRSPENVNLWQGVNGVNNPCPSGYRVPTQSEFDLEKATWSTLNVAGGFGSTLKLNAGGGRGSSGIIGGQVGSVGTYWTSTTSGVNYSQPLVLSSNNASYDPTEGRVVGRSVRCIKN